MKSEITEQKKLDLEVSQKIKELLPDYLLLLRRSIKRLFLTTYDFFRLDIIRALKLYYWYFSSLLKYIQSQKASDYQIELYPCLNDNLGYTPVEPIYFFQNAWAARHIFSFKPKYILDIGSPVTFLGIISQFVKVFFVDIRPPTIKVRGLEYVKGDILSLPFRDNSVDFISSLCVIEHIGLGRYGDKIDPDGSEKAIKQIKRILRPLGVALISLHVDQRNKIYFNAHRAFNMDYLKSILNGFNIIDQKFLYDEELYETYIREKGFGTVYLCLQKIG